MLTTEGMQKGRMRVLSGAEYAKAARLDARQEGWVTSQDIVLAGTTQINGEMSIPYPYYGDDRATVLRRDQGEHLVVELLKRLSPDGVLPEDAAELLDFITEVIRNGASA